MADFNDDVRDRVDRGLEHEPGPSHPLREQLPRLTTTCCALCFEIVELASVDDEGRCRACVQVHEADYEQLGLRSIWSVAQ